MALVTNTSDRPVGFSVNGAPAVSLQPGQSAEVRDVETLQKNKILAAWFRSGVLACEGDDAPVIAPDLTENEEKDVLIEKLAAFGIKKDRRKSVEGLQAELDEAIAAAGGTGEPDEPGDADETETTEDQEG